MIAWQILKGLFYLSILLLIPSALFLFLLGMVAVAVLVTAYALIVELTREKPWSTPHEDAQPLSEQKRPSS